MSVVLVCDNNDGKKTVCLRAQYQVSKILHLATSAGSVRQSTDDWRSKTTNEILP